MSVGVIVPRVIMLIDLRRGTSVRRFALVAFELNRRMIDPELLPQRSIHLLENAGAF